MSVNKQYNKHDGKPHINRI